MDGLGASVSVSDELLEPLLELLDFFASFNSSDTGRGTLAFLCSSMVTLCCSMFPLRGLDLFFPSSVLAVVDSESLELLDEEEEDGFLLNFVTAGGDGLFLVGDVTFVFLSDSDSLDKLLDFFLETKLEVLFFLLSESESELLFLSFVAFAPNFLFASVELVLELELLIFFFFSSFSDSLEDEECFVVLGNCFLPPSDDEFDEVELFLKLFNSSCRGGESSYCFLY